MVPPLPGVRTWQFDCAHGDLPGRREAFQAYLDLLATGTTDRLTHDPGGDTRHGGALQGTSKKKKKKKKKNRHSHTHIPPAHEAERDVFRGADDGDGKAAAPPEQALGITVHNGDLSFVGDPLIIGHYSSMKLTGTERVMNRLVDKTLQRLLDAGQYPDPVGTHQVS